MGYGVIQCLSKDPSIKRSGFSSPYSFHSFLVASKTRRYLKMVFLGQNGPCLNHPSLHFVLNFEDELITKRRFGADRIRVEYVSKPNPVELALIDPKWEYCRSQLKAPFFATMTTNQRPRNCDTSNRRVPFLNQSQIVLVKVALIDLLKMSHGQIVLPCSQWDIYPKW